MGSATGIASHDGAWRSPGERERGIAAARRGEFPPGADLPPDGWTRRELLALAGAAAALAGLSACGAKQAAEILPYGAQPPELTPGVPRFFATSLVRHGYATGLLAEAHDGRPTKLEGNPDHPASLGATSAVDQAAILELYDPDRARAPRHGMDAIAWRDIEAAFAQAPGDGRGLHLLLEPESSPLIASLLARLRERFPRARVHWHATAGHDAALTASERALGAPLLPHYALDRAEVVLALGADPLASGPWPIRHAHDWATRRRPRTPDECMSRWYVAEATPTCTGWSADHRLRVDERDLPALAAAILAAVLARRPSVAPATLGEALRAGARAVAPPTWIAAVADDLVRHAGAGAVIVGQRLPPKAHLLGLAIDEALGNTGTVRGHRRCALIGGERDSLPELAEALRAGEVETLIVCGGNPAFTAPPELELPRLLRGVPRSLRLGLFDDETARACGWFAPQAHWLEAWGDARAYDGTVSFIQPLIEPLYDGRGVADLLALLLGEAAPPRARLLASWQARGELRDPGALDEALRLGLLRGSALPNETARLDWDAVAKAIPSSTATTSTGIDLALALDAKVEDGRGANNPWLQELPDPITKLTWGNALLIAPALARQLGVSSGDEVELRARAGTLRAPALVVPGQAERTVALSVGYGRTAAGTHGTGVGVDAFPLRSAAERWLVRDVAIAATGQRQALAQTQEHWSMEDRPIVLSSSLADWRARPGFATEHAPAETSLRPDPTRSQPPSPQWGLVIDLAACTGCSACVIACQAENNVPTVGKDGVLRSREMHWLRVDRYYTGSAEDPSSSASQPMMCQHCEKAPCEYVCPTYATTHSPDGINEMTYNRCIGTRFCSNNCPYKVRRFNWFDYNDNATPVTRLAKNPDVTVRARGVMEKCTSCVQRVREAGISSRTRGEPLRDGDVRTACQQACPTRAIAFGDVGDPGSEVARLRAQGRAYGVLAETGARPRTRYLARIRNPDPDLA